MAPTTPGQAWQAGLLDEEPISGLLPEINHRDRHVMAIITILFVTLFYKELKLASFDEALAKALGLRPGILHYALMILVSLVAVGAFDAVGSILVIAFFIIPPAAAYLLTDRLSLMLLFSAIIGSLGAYFGYDLARGTFLIFFEISDMLAWLNNVFGLGLVEEWNSSISASMVMMIFFFFLLSWIFSPKYGLISTFVRRAGQKSQFEDQVVLAHIYNHRDTEDARQELTADTLHEHFSWSNAKMGRILTRLKALNIIRVVDNIVELTEKGEQRVQHFRETRLASELA